MNIANHITPPSIASHMTNMESHERFDVFFEAYIRYRSLHVRGSSLSQAKTVRNKYLSKWNGMTVIQTFSSENIADVYRNIAENPSLCPSWKNRILGVIRSMIAYAFKTKRIPADLYQDALSLIDNIPENRGGKKEKPIWSPKEEVRFLDSIENEDHKIMFRLFISLGARIGEFLGLTWDCFNSRKGTIEIRQQLLHNSQKTFQLSPILKSNESYRVCKLEPELKVLLLDYKKRSKHTKGFIFRSPIDSNLPLSKANFRWLLNKYIRLSGVGKITPHSVRHARASNLLKACRNMLEVVAVARYMGHSPSMLMDTYSHSQEKTINSVIKRVGKH